LAFITTRAALPGMPERGWTRLIYYWGPQRANHPR
jgi:hypothetical protein